MSNGKQLGTAGIQYDKNVEIKIDGNTFVFTGDFASGTKSDIEEKIISRGGIVKDSVTANTVYLVVGNDGSLAWLNGIAGGKKVEKVMDYKAKGKPIYIVSESQILTEFIKLNVGKAGNENNDLSEHILNPSMFTVKKDYNGTLSIAKYKGTSSKIIIPSEINGEKITKIGEKLFEHCEGLLSVIISEGISEIGDYAFRGCENLKSISFPKKMKEIGSNVFENCQSLETVILPEGIKVLEWGLFENCTNIIKIYIPKSIKTIESNVFTNCEKLESIIIPDHVSNIEDGVFEGCRSLKEIKLPTKLKVIESSLFSGCESLTAIDIPDSVKTIEHSAFSNCTRLEKIKFPVGLEKIDSWAFGYCRSLEYIILPESINEFGDCVFNDCIKLKSIVIPSTITRLGWRFFENCQSLEVVDLPKKLLKIDFNAFKGCVNLKSIEIPDSVEIIEHNTFDNCTSLTTINFPKNIKHMGTDVFKNCNQLELSDTDEIVHKILYSNENIPELIKSIGDKSIEWSPVLQALINQSLEIMRVSSKAKPISHITYFDEIETCLKQTEMPLQIFIDISKILNKQTKNNISNSSKHFLLNILENGATPYFSNIDRNVSINNRILEVIEYVDGKLANKIFEKMHIDLNNVYITNYEIDNLVSDKNISGIELIINGSESGKEYLEKNLSTFFSNKKYDVVKIIISNKDTFKSPKAPEYFQAFCTINDLNAVKILIEKGALSKINAIKTLPLIEKLSNNAATLLKEEINNLVGNKITNTGAITTEQLAELQISLNNSVKNGDYQDVIKLVEAGADIKNDDNFVLMAALNNDLELMKLLLTHKAKVTGQHNLINNPGEYNEYKERYSPLHIALMNNNDEMAILLVQAKASITKTNHLQQSSLELAVEQNRIHVVREMLKLKFKWTPVLATKCLELAVRTGNLELVELIYQTMSPFEFTARAVAYACRLGHIEIVDFLFSKNCSLDVNPKKEYNKEYKIYLENYGGGTVEDNFYHYFFIDNAGFLTLFGRSDIFKRIRGEAAPVDKRIAVLEYLIARRFLSEKQLITLLDYALYFEEVDFFETFEKNGIKSSHRMSEKFYHNNGNYYLASAGMGLRKLHYVINHLEPDEKVKITARHLVGDPMIVAELMRYTTSELCEKKNDIIKFFISTKCVQGLEQAAKVGLFTSRNLNESLELASKEKATEVVAYLLSLKDEQFSDGNKDYKL